MRRGSGNWWLGMGILLALGGCKKKPVVASIVSTADKAVVDVLREREIPDPLQARFSIKLRSEPLGLVVPPLGGGLIVDRPDKAHLVVMAPVGGPVIKMTTDGERLGLMISRGKQWVEEADGQGLIREATKGAVSLDDIVGLLLGLVPLQPEDVVDKSTVDGVTTIVARGPDETRLTALVDEATVTPRSLTVSNAEGAELVRAVYEPFELLDEVMMPTSVTVFVTAVELELGMKYKSWKPLEEAPDVFTIAAPDGFETISFQQLGEAMSQSLGSESSEDAPAE